MNTRPYRKVAFDMSIVQISWAVWFVGIVLAVYLITLYFGGSVEAENKLGQLFMLILNRDSANADVVASSGGFLAFILHPSKIFMLIVGILSVSGFLTYYAKLGVTRKAYFQGAFIGALALSLALAIMTGAIYTLDRFIFSTELQVSGNFISTVLLYSLFCFIYYTAGWLISAGFYRFGAGGLIFIVLAVALVFAIEVIWELTLLNSAEFNAMPEIMTALLGTIVVLAIALLIIRWSTKRVRIRLK